MIFFKSPLYPLLVVNMKSRSPREENVALCTPIDFWTKYLQFKYTVNIPIKSWFAKLCARKKLIIGSLSNDDGDGKENGNSWIKFDVSTAEAYMTSESIFLIWWGRTIEFDKVCAVQHDSGTAAIQTSCLFRKCIFVDISMCIESVYFPRARVRMKARNQKRKHWSREWFITNMAAFRASLHAPSPRESDNSLEDELPFDENILLAGYK